MRFLFVVFVSANLLLAQQNTSQEDGKSAYNWRFNQAKSELMLELNQEQKKADAEAIRKKSVLKAALLSAAVPGLGEFYSESYWRGALFAVIEVAAWTGYFTYENKGDSKDRQMRRYGDEHWSEQRYWSRVYDLAVQNNKWTGAPLSTNAAGIVPLSEIDGAISRLRYLETNGGFSHFSHSLPETKTQQYYEMIYKYLSQFGAGWEELGSDWAYYDNGKRLDALTPNVKKYKKMRNTSNDYYATATNMASIVLLNHLVSAIDAALATKTYNNKVQYSLYAGQKYYAGEHVRTYGIVLSW